jgi:hypothetical protein
VTEILWTLQHVGQANDTGKSATKDMCSSGSGQRYDGMVRTGFGVQTPEFAGYVRLFSDVTRNVWFRSTWRSLDVLRRLDPAVW